MYRPVFPYHMGNYCHGAVSHIFGKIFEPAYKVYLQILIQGIKKKKKVFFFFWLKSFFWIQGIFHSTMNLSSYLGLCTLEVSKHLCYSIHQLTFQFFMQVLFLPWDSVLFSCTDHVLIVFVLFWWFHYNVKYTYRVDYFIIDIKSLTFFPSRKNYEEPISCYFFFTHLIIDSSLGKLAFALWGEEWLWSLKTLFHTFLMSAHALQNFPKSSNLSWILGLDSKRLICNFVCASYIAIFFLGSF